MSAFMVSNAHIDVLLDIAEQYRMMQQYGKDLYWAVPRSPNPRSFESAAKNTIGRMLLAQNARSVGHRYNEARNPAALTYTYRSTGRKFTPGEALKAIGCYEYQACENDDWDQTEAHAFCAALRDLIAGVVIPFPDDAPWGYEEKDLQRTALV